jgi:hypothetical protein
MELQTSGVFLSIVFSWHKALSSVWNSYLLSKQKIIINNTNTKFTFTEDLQQQCIYKRLSVLIIIY